MFRQIAPNGIVNKEVHEKTASDEIDNRMATDGVHNAKPEADVLEVIEQAKQLKETPQGDETNRIEPTDGNQPPAPSKTESSEPAIANSSQAQSDREHKQSQALVDSAAPMISTQTQDDGTNKSPQSEAANSTKALDEPQPRTPSNFKSNENIPVVEPPAESLAAQSRAELHPTSSNSFESTHPDNKTKFGNNLEESKLSEQNQEGTLLTKNTESSAVPLPLSDIPAPGVPGPLPNETQSHRPQPGNQDALNQILAALQSVQSDYRQVSAKIDRFGERIRSLEGGQSNVNGATSIPSHAVATATSIPGNAVATAPESDETRRTHEEMSRITASECPFLMNSEWSVRISQEFSVRRLASWPSIHCWDMTLYLFWMKISCKIAGWCAVKLSFVFHSSSKSRESHSSWRLYMSLLKVIVFLELSVAPSEGSCLVMARPICSALGCQYEICLDRLDNGHARDTIYDTWFWSFILSECTCHVHGQSQWNLGSGVLQGMDIFSSSWPITSYFWFGFSRR